MSKLKLQPLNKTSHVKRRVLWFCLFLCIGGASLVCIGGKTCLKAWEARGWPGVSCTIDESGINSKGEPKHEPVFMFFVTYRYSYNGQEYHSQSANFDPDAEMDLKAAGALSNRFPPGALATCYVNPQNPAESVLDRSVSRQNLLAAIGGVGLVLVSFAGVMAARRK